jgi:hypothetical protein
LKEAKMGWRNWRLAGVWVVSLVLLGLTCFVAQADCWCEGDDCYEDVVVSGAGTEEINGTYEFDGMDGDGYPMFYAGGGRYLYFCDDSGTWRIAESDSCMSDPLYGNTESSSTPPSTGWDVMSGDAPAPTVSGGWECGGASIAVSAISGDTTEAGGTATFTLTPDPAPAADVTVPLSSSDTSEGTVLASVVLPSGSSDPVTITVTGVDDDVDDDDVAYTIVTGDPTSADSDYNALGAGDVDDVSVTNADDDTAGFTVAPTSGLETTEAGGTDTYTIVLHSEPTDPVQFSTVSGDSTEGTVSPALLTFTAADWDTPQTVTVTGVDDGEVDGDVAYLALNSYPDSDDMKYAVLDVQHVSVTNLDDDGAIGITVTPTSGLTTTEAGGTATFDVSADSAPAADVTVPLASSDATEGTVFASVVLPSGSTDPVTVTVTGVDDTVVDGDVAYTIVTGDPTSSDANYDALGAGDVDDIGVTNTDDETASITVDPTTGLTTTEAGGTDTFTVVLDVEPSGTVTVGISSSTTLEGMVDQASLTFTTSDWDTPQTVTITGVDDDVDDGDYAYTIYVAGATGGGYDGLFPIFVSVTNTDDDTKGITANPTSGLVTTEDGGADTFTVVLDSEPTDTVTMNIRSSDPSEGTAAPASLTFTPEDWDTPQIVTVTGQDDGDVDGDVAYTVSSDEAMGGGYDGLISPNVGVTNSDNEAPSIAVAPMTGLMTTEAGGTAEFSLTPSRAPAADVTVPLSSSNSTEGIVPASVVLPSGTTDPVTVTVTGVDDDIDDGDVGYTIVTGDPTSSDSGFDAVGAGDVDDVSVTNSDDDTRGVNVTPTSGPSTTEAGGTATFTVVLESEPTATVTIGVSSSDTTEGTVDPTTLAFTTADWDTPQTVTVTGVDDDVDDGDIDYDVVLAPASGGDYAGLDPSDVGYNNIDDDTVGITVTPTSGLATTEAGGTATFTVVLDTEPTGATAILVTSDDPSEGTAAPMMLVFTTDDWDTPQTVTVTGQDDSVDDGDVGYTIAVEVAEGGGYEDVDPVDVSVSNSDDDTKGITADPASGLRTTESGGTATFTVVLDTEPTGMVVLAVTSQDGSEGIAAPAVLFFGTEDWDAPQTVTVTGQDDNIDDGDVGYTIDVAVAESGGYEDVDPITVSVTNENDDTRGITVAPMSGLSTTETGGTCKFTVVLDTEPTGTTTIAVASGDTTEGIAVPATLTFTTSDWSTPQTVTVTGVDDFVDDGDIGYAIVTSPAVGGDYVGIDGDDVSVTNKDDDERGITVTPVCGLTTTEAGGTCKFTVVLDTEPTDTVTIGLSSNDPTEGTAAPSTLTFTPANWSTLQSVTVTGVDDRIADGDDSYFIVTSPAAGGDYTGIDALDVSITNVDDDVPGITVTPTGGLTTTEGGGTASFDLSANTPPTADVTVPLASTNRGEGTLAITEVVLPAGGTDPVTVTVTGVDDDIDDGDIGYTIKTGDPTSDDPSYDALGAGDVEDVSVTNTDDDVRGITVTPTSGLTTTEDGGTATFTVVLDTQPILSGSTSPGESKAWGGVMIELSSSNPAEGTVDPTALVFTPENWDEPQTVTVTGVDDDILDGDIGYTIVTAAAVGGDYDGLNAADVSVVNLDNEVAVSVVPTGDAGPEEFLDEILPVPEGEDPPMAGEEELAATHVVGDIITGSCQLLGPTGAPTTAGYVHLYLYSVDIATDPETRELLDHWAATFNWTTYEFELAYDTAGLAPGYYDLRLSFADGSIETFRIQLVPEPTE